jgi:hypothetical protein
MYVSACQKDSGIESAGSRTAIMLAWGTAMQHSRPQRDSGLKRMAPIFKERSSACSDFLLPGWRICQCFQIPKTACQDKSRSIVDYLYPSCRVQGVAEAHELVCPTPTEGFWSGCRYEITEVTTPTCPYVRCCTYRQKNKTMN